MCRPTVCEACGKTTWKGCGQHIDKVKATVPADQWCNGQHTDEERSAVRGKRGLFGCFFR